MSSEPAFSYAAYAAVVLLALIAAYAVSKLPALRGIAASAIVGVSAIVGGAYVSVSVAYPSVTWFFVTYAPFMVVAVVMGMITKYRAYVRSD